ncbi:hypothetical protein HALLA_08175 [Halostagnicola larsenii XH-48]|uniref:Uncharacterized protein n=1 Tax=Halostagnicola larsenii XH-48 TaxID=797299 RepID=W0JU40_9EURY|nr:hypothetical protein HALLA_08175 [Halostagnicola larsenii XH-48]
MPKGVAIEADPTERIGRVFAGGRSTGGKSGDGRVGETTYDRAVESRE